MAFLYSKSAVTPPLCRRCCAEPLFDAALTSKPWCLTCIHAYNTGEYGLGAAPPAVKGRTASPAPGGRTTQYQQAQNAAVERAERKSKGVPIEKPSARLVIPSCWKCHTTPLRPLDRCDSCWKEHLDQLTAYLATIGDTIEFYESDAPFYELTNFFPCPIVVEMKEYPTSEHFFQASKFLAYRWVADSIRYSSSPREAFAIAQRNRTYQRSDWHEVSMKVMKTALLAKFSIEPMRQVLILTGNRRLVEHTVNDNFWGNGGDYSGGNHLGLLLEEVRAELKSGPSRPLLSQHVAAHEAEQSNPKHQHQQLRHNTQYR